MQKSGIEPEIIKYLETPPTSKELESILKKMGRKPVEVIRFKEAIDKEMALKADDNRSDDEWIKLMIQHPKIIERPIVVNGDKAIMGRPPDGVLSIF